LPPYCHFVALFSYLLHFLATCCAFRYLVALFATLLRLIWHIMLPCCAFHPLFDSYCTLVALNLTPFWHIHIVVLCCPVRSKNSLRVYTKDTHSINIATQSYSLFSCYSLVVPLLFPCYSLVIPFGVSLMCNTSCFKFIKSELLFTSQITL